MTVVMQQARALRIPEPIEALPSQVQDVIERALAHSDALPTKETIEKICEDPIVRSHQERVLRYFLMESSLNLSDLRPLILMIGVPRARIICQGTAAIRLLHERHDWTARWA